MNPDTFVALVQVPLEVLDSNSDEDDDKVAVAATNAVAFPLRGARTCVQN